MKKKETAVVLSQEEIAEGIFSLILEVSFSDEVRAGQFVSLFSRDRSRLLPRPISVCEADALEGTIRLVYRAAGSGTKEFSHLKKGDRIDLIGPLGNGFPIDAARGKKILLIGGGIGIPPMLCCASELRKNRDENPAEIVFAAGYRSSDTYLLEELEKAAPVLISTDDGSLGTHGTVIDALREHEARADLIFSCGPKPMLRGVKAYAEELGIPCYVSMEERMACGIGVCLGCVTGTTRTDAHSLVKNARVCKDGPVFDAEYVDLS